MGITSRKNLIVIVGPNASGKTSLAIKLAKKFKGEIVSADSRQVFKGMNLGTGKATKAEQRQVKHHLLDVVKPTQAFNVSHFKKLAISTIKQIQQKGKLPFLVGGTGFWVQAIVDDLDFPAVKPNKILRKKLAKKTPIQLFKMLKKLDPKRAKVIDKKNPYRLIRAIEIIKTTKKPIAPLKKKKRFNALILGPTHSREKLYQRIDQRLKKRLAQGMINEVRKLRRRGASWKRLYDLGLEYRFISLYLQNKLTKEEMSEQLKNAIHHYAKRQMTWFQRDKRIRWIKNQGQAEKSIKKFLK
jgi:tRNA dimethylallyltransferase